MAKISIHRKAKGATVLTKRTQLLRKYYQRRSYKPLYEKLKSNNNYLAKALSRAKRNCQSLFSQNIALIAEVQELRVACNARDSVIFNITNNTKEMLKILVNSFGSLSGYATNTISMGQELASSSANLRLSPISAGRKESTRRLSTKSPARGVVKPMVSGHTITKPTINLSRVNMEHINNPSRLSDIQEVPIPDRSPQMNETRSPIAVSIPITQLRYEDGRTCRMPERLAVPSPRINNTIIADSEQRIRRKRSHSKRMSGSYSQSKSNRWSDENLRNSAGYINQLGSPRVELNDVSKLLRNSQSINVKRLFENTVNNTETQESSDEASPDTSYGNVVPETEVSVNINSHEEAESYAQTSNQSPNTAQTSRKTSDKDFWRLNVSKKPRLRQNNWEDPLEGPSWLFNNNLVASSRDNGMKPDNLNVSDASGRRSRNNVKVAAYNDESSDGENGEEELPLPNSTKYINNVETPKQDLSFIDHDKNNVSPNDTTNDSFCAMLPTVVTSNRGERNFDNENNDDARNLSQFVTLRRGHPKAIKEQTEDFTLMFARQPARNMHFDVSELQLPVLERSMISTTIANEIDNEVTTSIRRITNVQIPSISNQSMDESYDDPTTTLKLPLTLVNDYNRMSILAEKSKHPDKTNKKIKTSSLSNDTNHNKSMTVKSNAWQRNKSENIQDPSAAKVVLEKLNRSYVKVRTPSPDNMRSRNDNGYERDISNREDSPRDSESNESNAGSIYSTNRPKRKKAPMNLREPNLIKKLRRNP